MSTSSSFTPAFTLTVTMSFSFSVCVRTSVYLFPPSWDRLIAQTCCFFVKHPAINTASLIQKALLPWAKFIYSCSNTHIPTSNETHVTSISFSCKPNKTTKENTEKHTSFCSLGMARFSCKLFWFFLHLLGKNVSLFVLLDFFFGNQGPSLYTICMLILLTEKKRNILRNKHLTIGFVGSQI